MFFLKFVLVSIIFSGLSLRAGGRGFSPATKRVVPGYFYWKIEPKEIPSRLIPRLLVVFTRQLEILVTTLVLNAQIFYVCYALTTVILKLENFKFVSL